MTTPVRRAIAIIGILVSMTLAPARAASRSDGEDAWMKGGGTATIVWGHSISDGSYGLPETSQLGLRFGMHLSSRYDLEIGYEGAPVRTVSDPGSILFRDRSVVTTTGPVDFRSESFQARLMISPVRRRVWLHPYVLAGLGRLNFFSESRLPASERGLLQQGIFVFGAGLRQYFNRFIALRIEYAGEAPFERTAVNQRMNVGLSFELNSRPPADADRDGVIDFRDHCPGTPAGALVDKTNGCPYDLDGDGVPEGIDLCPQTPAGWSVDASGCPTDGDGDKVPDALDRCAATIPGSTVDAAGCPSDEDGDGIPDGIDQCAATPAGAQVDPVGSATPGCTHDLDGDGVPAGLDHCARTPQGAKVDASGCPIDSDGDGVYDGLDLCPDSPAGRLHDRDGCPRVRLDRDEPQPLENVLFLKGADLRPGAEAWVALAAEALDYWSDLKVEVAVAAEPGGAPAARKRAARMRALTVRTILLAKGIAPDRVTAVAAPPSAAPVADETAPRVTIRRLSGDLRLHPASAPSPAPATDEVRPDRSGGTPSSPETPRRAGSRGGRASS